MQRKYHSVALEILSCLQPILLPYSLTRDTYTALFDIEMVLFISFSVYRTIANPDRSLLTPHSIPFTSITFSHAQQYFTTHAGVPRPHTPIPPSSAVCTVTSHTLELYPHVHSLAASHTAGLLTGGL